MCMSHSRKRRLLLMSWFARRAIPATMMRYVRDSVWVVDSQQPVDEITTLIDVRKESLASPRLTTVLLGIFAGLALVITVTGISGVMALTVSQRTHEIGVRMALGATPSNVMGMVMGQGLILAAGGLLLGVFGALWLARLMSGLLYGVQPTDPLTFTGVSIGFLLLRRWPVGFQRDGLSGLILSRHSGWSRDDCKPLVCANRLASKSARFGSGRKSVGEHDTEGPSNARDDCDFHGTRKCDLRTSGKSETCLSGSRGDVPKPPDKGERYWWLSGQMPMSEIAKLKAKGFNAVINLRTGVNITWPQRKLRLNARA